MPAAFERARKAGAKIRTISGPNKKFGLTEGQYMHVAILNGKLYRGYKKRKGMMGDGE